MVPEKRARSVLSNEFIRAASLADGDVALKELSTLARKTAGLCVAVVILSSCGGLESPIGASGSGQHNANQAQPGLQADGLLPHADVGGHSAYAACAVWAVVDNCECKAR